MDFENSKNKQPVCCLFSIKHVISVSRPTFYNTGSITAIDTEDHHNNNENKCLLSEKK